MEQMSRKIVLLTNRYGNNKFADADIPSIPEGMKLPADTVKDLKAVAALTVQDDRAKKQLASICFFCTFYANERYSCTLLVSVKHTGLRSHIRIDMFGF